MDHHVKIRVSIKQALPVWWSPMINSCWPLPIGTKESTDWLPVYKVSRTESGIDTGSLNTNTGTVGIKFIYQMVNYL